MKSHRRALLANARAVPPRLRVDGRRSGCWHRKQSKDVNSKLACDLAALSQFAAMTHTP